MRRGDRVEIAREMQIDLLHRNDLRITTTSRTTLHAEAWAERRLAKADCRLLADPVQAIAQTNCRRRLAFTCRRRVDRRYKDQLAVLLLFERRNVIEIDLGDATTIRLDRTCWDRKLVCNFLNGTKCCFARNFDVAFHAVAFQDV